MRAYGIVAVFFVAKFDGGYVPSRHDCSIKRFTGERPRNRLPALPSSPALCADVARQLVVVIVDY